MADGNNSGCGLGICEVLFIVFVVLKLTGLIDWSWWWVTAPMWIPLAGLVVVVLFAIVHNCLPDR